MPASLQINIDQPCNENWENMTPNEQGRFCGSCQKTVVDFSVMTDQEILDHITKASGGICARATPDQLNKKMPLQLQKKRYSLAYLWNLLLASFLLAKTNAQVAPVKNKKPPVTKAPGRQIMGLIAMAPEPSTSVVPVAVQGVVLDSVTNRPVEGATIMIKDQDRGTSADSIGGFRLKPDQQKPVELVISMIGYETKTVLLDHQTNWQQIKVYLKPGAELLGDVVVTGYDATRCTGITGGIRYTRTVTTSEKIKRKINEWTPAVLKKDIKAFPNPVIRGNTVQVSLALKQPGEYKLELLDAGGKVVMVQSIQMPVKERTVSIPVSEVWSAGVYWIRISGRQIKNVYQSKVLIQ